MKKRLFMMFLLISVLFGCESNKANYSTYNINYDYIVEYDAQTDIKLVSKTDLVKFVGIDEKIIRIEINSLNKIQSIITFYCEDNSKIIVLAYKSGTEISDEIVFYNIKGDLDERPWTINQKSTITLSSILLFISPILLMLVITLLLIKKQSDLNILLEKSDMYFHKEKRKSEMLIKIVLSVVALIIFVFIINKGISNFRNNEEGERKSYIVTTDNYEATLVRFDNNQDLNATIISVYSILIIVASVIAFGMDVRLRISVERNSSTRKKKRK